ncbi:aspartate aminotransferase family protein [Methanolobus profundi]|uniref:Acetylornithine/N-succinyldiaminopimelate aminotransferase n=1 Tax=Methanolobus profundi TaxID=487685 RepID=A0A1I4QUU6_9EURY|nr:aspartate aminotransferase family protein [Methanolobus profundi]SFM43781.1 acetylornithine/N-succinyldiaminopimelate aminotransferase [Methanolobus profundi]
MPSKETFEAEDKYFAPFFVKQKISVEKGEGVYVWDEEGRRYLDFTAGWGVTCIGHANPVITDALVEQGQKIIQNPNSGLTYSPARARLLSLMQEILPSNLTRVFFTNSGAETNDAAIKLARKVTGRPEIVSTYQSFHGRTISTASATGQAKSRDRYHPLMPNYRFVPYNDLNAMEEALDENVAAVIIEPIQGEGGIRIPSSEYLKGVSDLCKKNGSLLIIDEIQTGFFRTGPAFLTSECGVEVDFLTMAKGIAGGFPFGAFAVSEEVADKFEIGDHGGTYCGNPLGCAVSYAVIKYLIDNDISGNVERMGQIALDRMEQWQAEYSDVVAEVRGKGLLIMIEFRNEDIATKVKDSCLEKGLLVTQTQGIGIRIFPALNITEDELEEGLQIMEDAIASVLKSGI